MKKTIITALFTVFAVITANAQLLDCEQYEICPRFPGGDKALLDFIKSNICYPKCAKEKGIEGRVIVSFYVETDGGYDKLKTKAITDYNCALAVEEKYLNRFEFYRQLLNSNKKLAAAYITGNANDANILAKWVLETADRTTPWMSQASSGHRPTLSPEDTSTPSAWPVTHIPLLL